jgi:hypothetical protein
MKKTKIALFLFLLTLNQVVFGAAIIPDNDLNNPPLIIKDFDSVSERDFNLITSRLHRIYGPEIEAKSGLKFVMIADWNDGVANAYATRSVDAWNVHINGGIARAKGMTDDGFALIVCHEIGHHLGGAPRTYLYEGWASAEGQADYFATSKCLKRYYTELALEENFSISNHSIPEKVILDCNSVYKNLSDLQVCVRSQLASLDFAHFLNSLPDVRTPVSLEALDPKVVKGTNTNDYPRPQCRFDTLYQGSLCAIHSNVATSDTDAKIGHCNDESKPGTRPRCWYKP